MNNVPTFRVQLACLLLIQCISQPNLKCVLYKKSYGSLYFFLDFPLRLKSNKEFLLENIFVNISVIDFFVQVHKFYFQSQLHFLYDR